MNDNQQSKQATSTDNQSGGTEATVGTSETSKAETSGQGKKQEKSSFEVYCDNNPSAAECRIYED